MVNVPYTLVVTSCGRHDLLLKTLESFVKYADIPPLETIIIEDGPSLPGKAIPITDKLGKIKTIVNEKSKGQIYSVDRAYSEVTTPYIFHCEDDWEFTGTGFIEASFRILEDVENQDIITVSLRSEWNHPEKHDPEFPFPIAEPGWNGGWGHFTFNPGLRRLADWQKIGSYGRLVGYDPRIVAEIELSKIFNSENFFIAIGPKCVRHIGEGRHVQFTHNRKPPKVLIAIPACHKYEYKEQADGRWHKDGYTNAKVEAVRDTWAKYMPPFASYVDLKFFYGKFPANVDREMKEDEILLECPDDYKSLPWKVKAIYEWALDNGYDYVFKCDDDTFVYVDRLMSSGFEEYDYIGYLNKDMQIDNGLYCAGGSGYWLSKTALKLVTRAIPQQELWAEDAWVGRVMNQAGIKPTRDARYLPGFWEHYIKVNDLPEDHSYISMHSCTPDMMKQLYNKTVSANFTPVRIAFNELDTPQAKEMQEFYAELDELVSSIKLTDEEMPELNKETKNRVNKSLERIANDLLKLKKRVDSIENRLALFNQKASHKI